MVFAKAKAWHTHAPLGEGERATFRTDQEDAILRAMGTYNPDPVVVYGPDFGHTDPQYVLPYRGVMTVDGPAHRISATY